jgi:hypothetical protein
MPREERGDCSFACPYGASPCCCGALLWHRDSRLKREARAQKEEIQRRKSTLRRDPDQDEGVDLGLGRGMKEPSMRLPPPAEQLWLETAPDGSHTAQQGGAGA